jgi:DNA polymerase
MSRIISIDFETFYSTKLKYSIKTMGDYLYLNDPRFNAYLVAVSDGEDTWAGPLRHFNWNSLEGQTLLSHNKRFDSAVYKRLVALGIVPKITPAKWLCTADMSACLCNRRALDAACEHLLNIEVSKDIRDRANGKTPEEMKAEGWWGEMVKYGKRDAFNCWTLFDKHGHRWNTFERRLSEQTCNQGERGIQIDVARLEDYIKTAHTMLKDAEQTLPWIAEGRPPTSPKAIAEHCRLHHIPSPPIKSHDGEEAFIEWENTYGPKHVWIANVANWRSINKFLGSIETIKERLTPEGVLEFRLKYFGAHTGRWSGDAGINMQNLKKEPLYRDDKGFLITDASKLKEIEQSKTLPSFVTASLDIRSIFIARPGKDLIVSDLSQIEPRVLAWVTGNKKMLDLMAGGMSPYEAFARAQMGWTAGKLKDEDKDKYALSKAQVLGLGFGCGWEKFIVVAQTMAGIDITAGDPLEVPVLNDEGLPCLNKDGTPKMESGYGFNSKRIVREFRRDNPLTVGLWKHLDEAFKASAMEGEFRMELPSGREMVYRKVAREWVSHFDEEEKRYKRKCCVTAEAVKNGRLMRVPLYGGLLTENLVQATAREVFGEHCLALDQEFGDGTVLFTSHDEAIGEYDKSVTAKDVERVMSVTPEWLKGCPIAAEAKKVPHYLK